MAAQKKEGVETTGVPTARTEEALAVLVGPIIEAEAATGTPETTAAAIKDGALRKVRTRRDCTLLHLSSKLSSCPKRAPLRALRSKSAKAPVHIPCLEPHAYS